MHYKDTSVPWRRHGMHFGLAIWHVWLRLHQPLRDCLPIVYLQINFALYSVRIVEHSYVLPVVSSLSTGYARRAKENTRRFKSSSGEEELSTLFFLNFFYDNYSKRIYNFFAELL